LRERIMARPGWDKVTAVKKGKVYILSSYICAGPSGVVGVACMAGWFHPELSKDLDPQKLYQEYLDRFQRIPYRGYYVYPEGH
jgi:iron complex transport system substrate-binding protein